MSDTIAYFMGVWPGTGAGHYCYKVSGELAGQKEPVSPWSSDYGVLAEGGGVLSFEGTHQPEGEPVVGRRNGWTIVALWDRSEDKRGNCSASFCVNEDMADDDAAVARMKKLFPAVWLRIEAHLGHVVGGDDERERLPDDVWAALGQISRMRFDNPKTVQVAVSATRELRRRYRKPE